MISVAELVVDRRGAAARRHVVDEQLHAHWIDNSRMNWIITRTRSRRTVGLMNATTLDDTSRRSAGSASRAVPSTRGRTSRPPRAAVCLDDRQYVGRDGQRWTTHDELAATLHLRIEDDDGLLGIGIAEPFAIPQRALVVREGGMTVLWDCVSVVDAARQWNNVGEIDAIAISHPHFYSSMVEWSDALGGIPILLHAADRDWIARPSPAVQLWSGDRHDLARGVDAPAPARTLPRQHGPALAGRRTRRTARR